MWKTVVYTNVNEQQKSKKVILLSKTLTFGDVLLGKLIFAVFDM